MWKHKVLTQLEILEMYPVTVMMQQSCWMLGIFSGLSKKGDLCENYFYFEINSASVGIFSCQLNSFIFGYHLTIDTSFQALGFRLWFNFWGLRELTVRLLLLIGFSKLFIHTFFLIGYTVLILRGKLGALVQNSSGLFQSKLKCLPFFDRRVAYAASSRPSAWFPKPMRRPRFATEPAKRFLDRRGFAPRKFYWLSRTCWRILLQGALAETKKAWVVWLLRIKASIFKCQSPKLTHTKESYIVMIESFNYLKAHDNISWCMLWIQKPNEKHDWILISCI